MLNYHTEIAHLEHKRKAIHEEVRHIHLANRIHRAKRSKMNNTCWRWLHSIRRLAYLQIHISFDFEDPNPEPEGTS